MIVRLVIIPVIAVMAMVLVKLFRPMLTLELMTFAGNTKQGSGNNQQGRLLHAAGN